MSDVTPLAVRIALDHLSECLEFWKYEVRRTGERVDLDDLPRALVGHDVTSRDRWRATLDTIVAFAAAFDAATIYEVEETL